MPRYAYKAKDGPGRTVEGEINADSRASAIAKMDSRGLSPISVEEKDDHGAVVHDAPPGRISQREITVFTRQLASLTKSSVPILKALSTIAGQNANVALRRVTEGLERTIRDGTMLSEAMAKYPTVFSGLYVNMVRSGESAGVLDKVLLRLAEAREREDELRRKVQAALAYPILIVVVGVATVFLLLSFFLPRVTVLFKNYADLPLPTKMLIGMSQFFSNSWYWIVLVVILAGAVIQRLSAQEKGRLLIDRIKLRTPLAGGFLLKQDMSRFSRTLSLLLQAGINIDKALTLSADTMGNAFLREEVRQAADATIRQGLPFSAGIRRVKFFPPLFANMCAVGEESGKLDESLTEIASFYETEIEQQSRIATSLLEPIMILVVGGIVGFIVAAMLLPIFRLSSAL